MPTNKPKRNSKTSAASSTNKLTGQAASLGASAAAASVEDLLLAAMERGGDTMETGRYIVTFKEGVEKEGIETLSNAGMRVADARDFNESAVMLESVGDADAVVFPEIGAALISGQAAQERQMSSAMELETDSAYQSVDPEYFVFADEVYNEVLRELGTTATEKNAGDYLRGFLAAAEAIAKDLAAARMEKAVEEADVDTQVLGATWGLRACRVPTSPRSGVGIKLAVLDTGMDIGHPDFAGRNIAGVSFVGGQPVQDLNGHGTHCIGTATGPKAPGGTTPRYGIGYRSLIRVGKVLSNSGSGTQAGVLAGMNWAIANRCPVISMSLGSQSPAHPAYTAAGQAALNNGCLIIAAAGNAYRQPTGSPANSPTIMSVASLNPNLTPSDFSNAGKIDIAGPGRDVFSTWFRPRKYHTISGTSMATPHVAGCAALWAETSPNLRGLQLWRKLQATARRLQYAGSLVGAGLVQAPQI